MWIQAKTWHVYVSYGWPIINENYLCCVIPSLIWRGLSSSVQACIYTCVDYLHRIMKSNQLKYNFSETNISPRLRTSLVRKMFCSCLERRFPMQQLRCKSNRMMSSIYWASLCNTSQMPEEKKNTMSLTWNSMFLINQLIK